MKRLLMNKIVKFNQLNFPSSRIVFLPLLLILALLSGFQGTAQCPQPGVTVRFANPHYHCPTHTYCVDVEFRSNTTGQQLFGMNVRFFYDDNILEYLGMGDFPAGYTGLSAEKLTGPDGSGVNFGFTGPSEWINGKVQKVSDSTPPIYISTTGWTKLFSVCFHVDDPNSISITNFCPSIVWDLQQNPPDPETGKGYLHGDDSVVISFVDATHEQESKTTAENVIQFNWQYDDTGDAYGHPVSVICVSTTCGYVIPLANWSLFLALGLMLIASVLIYRKRIS
jgi:hypothetical protein